MNRTCNGKMFMLNGSWHWRCLGCGDIIKLGLPLKDGATCSACDRPIVLNIVEIETRIKIIQQICFKDNRDWFDFKEIST